MDNGQFTIDNSEFIIVFGGLWGAAKAWGFKKKVDAFRGINLNVFYLTG